MKLRTLGRYLLNPLDLWRKIQQTYVRPLILQNKVKHIHGAKSVSYGEDELIVLCVARNGEIHVKSFIEHYLGLGVKHIIILDNNSTDKMVSIARQYDKVTILQANLPFKKYENVMRQYLVDRFSKNRWNLLSDIDELFDYPYSNLVSIRDFIRYLNANSYTAVVCQMLDMFSDKSLAELSSSSEDSLKESYPFYDISCIEKEPYPACYGEVSNENICWHMGGVRKHLFGTNNYLSKAALTLIDGKIKTFVNCHQVLNASVADVTCVLFHYPFVSSFYSKVAGAVKDNRYALSAVNEYRDYWQELRDNPNLSIKQDSASQLADVNSLIDNGFLVISDQYLDWVKATSSAKLNAHS